MGQGNEGTTTGEWYDIVRRSDGENIGTLRLKLGSRVLLNLEQSGLNHKDIQKDERIVSWITLAEMVREMSPKN